MSHTILCLKYRCYLLHLMFIVTFITTTVIVAVVYCPGIANRKPTSMTLGRRTASGYLIEELAKHHHHL